MRPPVFAVRMGAGAAFATADPIPEAGIGVEGVPDR